MNILYIACSCSPNYGSEDKIGWNIPLESAKQNNVWVIAREESRKEIEDYINKYNIQNPRFFYIEIPRIIKTLFKPPFYTTRLNAWHKRAFKLAKQLCKEENIDIVHQITPIEFRSIGNYGKIPGVKFVCGPLGGGEILPGAFSDYIGKNCIFEYIRCKANIWYKKKYKYTKRVSNFDYILFANKETKNYLAEWVKEQKNNEIFLETGILEENIIEEPIEKDRLTFLLAGRLVYRKGHKFCFDTMQKLNQENNWRCLVAGDGEERQVLEQFCKEKIINKVTFLGNIPYEEMQLVYKQSSVFILPSLRDTSGAVILEAMANGLPVVTVNRFGGAEIVNNDCGWLYDGETKEEMIEALKNILIECIEHPEEVVRKGKNAVERAKDYTWDKRAAHYQEIYERLLSEG